MPKKNAAIPAAGGSYVLILNLAKTTKIRVGRLGCIDFKRGYYAYVGSALGPGGLAARIRHHLKPAKNPHWHIDYLGRVAVITEIFLCEGPRRFEHVWAQKFSELTETGVPAKGFGSSDCRCLTHLFYMKKRPLFYYLKEFLSGEDTRLTTVSVRK
jgi:Uri superfamily endonuclease